MRRPRSTASSGSCTHRLPRNWMPPPARRTWSATAPCSTTTATWSTSAAARRSSNTGSSGGCRVIHCWWPCRRWPMAFPPTASARRTWSSSIASTTCSASCLQRRRSIACATACCGSSAASGASGASSSLRPRRRCCAPPNTPTAPPPVERLPLLFCFRFSPACTRRLGMPRGRLALPAEIAAAAGHDDTPDLLPAAEAALPFPAIDAVAPLELARPALGVHIVCDRGAAEANGSHEYVADGAIELHRLSAAEPGSVARRMDARPPEALIRVDVPNPAEDVLVEQHRLDPGAPAGQAPAKLLLGGFQRIKPQPAEEILPVRFRHQGQAAEAADIGVAEFAAVVEQQLRVRVKRRRLLGGLRGELAGHAQVHDQKARTAGAVRRPETQQKEFPIASDVFDARARQIAFERRRIVHEIRLAQPHGEDAPAGQRGAQPASDGLDFRQFRHDGLPQEKYHNCTDTRSPTALRRRKRR